MKVNLSSGEWSALHWMGLVRRMATGQAALGGVMTATMTIASRFNGPVASGNGGYSAGLAARLALGETQAVEATLRAPIPLDATLRLHATADGVDVLTDDAAQRILVMSLRPAELAPPSVVAPSLAGAIAATAGYPGADDHVLPTCFVCGPARHAGDGLRIFANTLSPADNPNGFSVVAAPWTPSAGLADASGRIAVEFIWAALDCPGAFAIEAEPILLGRMTAKILARPRAGEVLIVAAWRTGSERRKHFAGTALFSEAGKMLAFSEQTWVQIDAHAHQKA